MKARTRSSPCSASSGTTSIRPTAARPARCTTRSRPPTGRSTTRRSGRPTSASPTTPTCLFDDSAGANSMRKFYEEQSSNRYTVNGEVTGWGKVQYNEARYGNNACGGIVCSTVWRFVNESADAWAATMSTADLNAKLAKYDVWDRYDYNGDGNFNEPDGYIDHFQSIHAGVGEETGGGAQGADAIWSHRWYAYYPGSPVGPDGAGPHGLPGRADREFELLDRRLHDRAGERRCRRVLARVRPRPRPSGRVRHVGQHGRRRERHGLLDADVAGLVRQQRHRGRGHRRPAVPHERVGQAPARLARLQPRSAPATRRRRSSSVPAEATTKQDQAVVVVLPEQAGRRSTSAQPYAGSKFYYSGTGTTSRRR